MNITFEECPCTLNFQRAFGSQSVKRLAFLTGESLLELGKVRTVFVGVLVSSQSVHGIFGKDAQSELLHVSHLLQKALQVLLGHPSIYRIVGQATGLHPQAAAVPDLFLYLLLSSSVSGQHCASPAPPKHPSWRLLSLAILNRLATPD